MFIVFVVGDLSPQIFIMFVVGDLSPQIFIMFVVGDLSPQIFIASKTWTPVINIKKLWLFEILEFEGHKIVFHVSN